jgi:hypothetical protein
MMTGKKLLPTLDIGSHSNAAGERRATRNDTEEADTSLRGGPSAPVAG